MIHLGPESISECHFQPRDKNENTDTPLLLISVKSGIPVWHTFHSLYIDIDGLTLENHTKMATFNFTRSHSHK